MVLLEFVRGKEISFKKVNIFLECTDLIYKHSVFISIAQTHTNTMAQYNKETKLASMRRITATESSMYQTAVTTYQELKKTDDNAKILKIKESGMLGQHVIDMIKGAENTPLHIIPVTFRYAERFYYPKANTNLLSLFNKERGKKLQSPTWKALFDKHEPKFVYEYQHGIHYQCSIKKERLTFSWVSGHPNLAKLCPTESHIEKEFLDLLVMLNKKCEGRFKTKKNDYDATKMVYGSKINIVSLDRPKPELITIKENMIKAIMKHTKTDPNTYSATFFSKTEVEKVNVYELNACFLPKTVIGLMVTDVGGFVAASFKRDDMVLFDGIFIGFLMAFVDVVKLDALGDMAMVSRQ